MFVSYRIIFSLDIHFTETVYNRLHLFLGLILGTGHRTALIASSKTVLRPFWVRAEHSRYLTAPTSLAMANPCNQKYYDSPIWILLLISYLGVGNRSQLFLLQLFYGLLVFSQVLLCTHQNNWNMRTVVSNFVAPFSSYVLKTCRGHKWETDEEYILVFNINHIRDDMAPSMNTHPQSKLSINLD